MGVSVNCMPVGYFKKDAGLKLAMSFANEKKKTLLIDLGKEPEGKEAGNSISRYVLGDESRPVPTTQNSSTVIGPISRHNQPTAN